MGKRLSLLWIQWSTAVESVQKWDSQGEARSISFTTTLFNLTAKTAAVNSSRCIDTALLGARRALPMTNEQSQEPLQSTSRKYEQAPSANKDASENFAVLSSYFCANSLSCSESLLLSRLPSIALASFHKKKLTSFVLDKK